jgi:small subunit ribosomal protein S21
VSNHRGKIIRAASAFPGVTRRRHLNGQHPGAACLHLPTGKHMRVERRDGESVEQLIRRFNKGVISERITKTYREKMHFISKSEQRKEKRRRAERNRRKKMYRNS